MKQAIGFANTFYTLWNVIEEMTYFTDANGKYWPLGKNVKYHYQKNISTDIAKVKELFPNVAIDENLHGVTQSWTRSENEDLCPNIMKFGKYIGRDIDDLVKSDFKYILWICENSYGANVQYARQTPEVIAHYANVAVLKETKEQEKESKFKSILSDGFFEFLAEKNLKVDGDYAYIHVDIDGLVVTFHFDINTFAVYEYNGFPYGLPLVKGKAKRMKGKTVKFEFDSDAYEGHTILVKNVIVK